MYRLLLFIAFVVRCGADHVDAHTCTDRTDRHEWSFCEWPTVIRIDNVGWDRCNEHASAYRSNKLIENLTDACVNAIRIEDCSVHVTAFICWNWCPPCGEGGECTFKDEFVQPIVDECPQTLVACGYDVYVADWPLPACSEPSGISGTSEAYLRVSEDPADNTNEDSSVAVTRTVNAMLLALSVAINACL